MKLLKCRLAPQLGRIEQPPQKLDGLPAWHVREIAQPSADVRLARQSAKKEDRLTVGGREGGSGRHWRPLRRGRHS